MGPLLDVFNITGVGLMDINGSKPNDVFFNENQIFLEFHLGPQDGDIRWSENRIQYGSTMIYQWHKRVGKSLSDG